MTKVTRKFGAVFFSAVMFLCAASLQAQVSTAVPVKNTSPPAPSSAESLYTRLSNVGLDKNRIYNIRDASLDREAIRISLNDGTIGFTEDVAGRVTGAFFEGEGEILLMPSGQAERESMALFTGAAILEEKFGTAYFRFNDDTFQQLMAYMLPAEGTIATDFYAKWNGPAKNLAVMDALRLFISFSQFLPPASAEPSETNLEGDRLFHARLQGRTLGDFDAYYDSTAAEQIWVGQSKTVDGKTYYDMWSSFALHEKEVRHEKLNSVNGEIGNSSPIVVTNYKISTVVKPPTEISSDALLQLEAQQGGERTLLFELSRFLNVQRVEADGKEVEFIHNPSLEGTQISRRGNDLIVVLLPEPLRKGQKLQLHFVYGGDVLSKAGAGLLYVGDKGTWYPNFGFSYSNFDLEFRYPQAWILIATGKREAANPSVPPLAVDEQSSRWISQRPIPVAGFNLGEYKEAQAQAGGIKVEVYATNGVEKDFPKASSSVVPTLPAISSGHSTISLAPSGSNPSPARNVQRVADETAQAVNFFDHHFGPFPYQGLSVTQIPGVMSQGWPGLVFLSTYAFLSDEEKSRLQIAPVQQIMSDAVVAHETAHQWWGDLVGWNSYRDQWMIEALANYSSMMLLESEDRAKCEAVMDFYRNDLLRKQKNDKPLMDAGPVTLGVRLSSSQFPHGYIAISYGRGTWLLHMLREMMDDGVANDHSASDSPFMRALLKLRTQYEGKALTTQEMLRVFEDEMPPSTWYEGRKSLDWFYDGWVNGTAIPKLELKDVKFSRVRSATIVTGIIAQNEAPDALITSVPLYAVTSHDHNMVFLARIFADGPQSAFRLHVPAGTRKIVLDPYNSVLSRP